MIIENFIKESELALLSHNHYGSSVMITDTRVDVAQPADLLRQSQYSVRIICIKERDESQQNSAVKPSYLWGATFWNDLELSAKKVFVYKFIKVVCDYGGGYYG